MKNWINGKSILFSQIGVVLFALLLAVLDLWCYPIVNWFGTQRQMSWQTCMGMLGVLYACSVPGWLLLWAMWRLLGNLKAEKIFTRENVRLLVRISACCAVAAAFCLVGCFFYLPFLIAVAAAGFMALIVKIVGNVFRTALDMKTELDYTI